MKVQVALQTRIRVLMRAQPMMRADAQTRAMMRVQALMRAQAQPQIAMRTRAQATANPPLLQNPALLKAEQR